MSTVNMRHMNAVVGVLRYVNDDGVVLVECDEVFETVVVPSRIINAPDAMMLVDRVVCLHDSKVYQL